MIMRDGKKVIIIECYRILRDWCTLLMHAGNAPNISLLDRHVKSMRTKRYDKMHNLE